MCFKVAAQVGITRIRVLLALFAVNERDYPLLFLQLGESYLGYLFIYPIFILTDIAIPIFLLIKWSRIKEYLILQGN